MSTQPSDPAIKGFECKHVVYSVARDGSPHDIVTIKENIHYHDGRIVPNVRTIVDFQRPFWITKGDERNKANKGHRNHVDKKEWEDVHKLQKFASTQITLAAAITRALGQVPSGRFQSLRMTCRSPYVYGADVTTPVLIKHHYMETWPQVNGANATPFSVCNLDTETDMVNGTEEILMLSLAMGPKVHLIVSQRFLKNRPNVEQEIRQAFHYYMEEDIKRRGIVLTIQLVETAADVAYHGMKQVHAWQPDILAIWNMDFDIPKMAKDLEKGGYDLGEVFSDPKIPPVFRRYKYIQGASQKVTQSGKTMPLPYFDRWHTLEVPASYQVLDAMCIYRKLRFSKGMEGSYSLDAVLKRNGCHGKLKFKEADHVTGAQWHAFMQKNYPIEYCVYNIRDTVAMQDLDEKTGDLSLQVGLHSGHSEFNRFPSQPRRTWDDLHFMCLKHGKVAATTSDTMRTDLDAMVIGLNGHIVTLPSHQVMDTGLKILKEMPDFPTMCWSHVADLDVKATYPTTEGLLNISKETTVCELAGIEGVDERTQRSVGINLTGGHVNAVEICTRVYKAPPFDTLLADYRAERAGVEPAADTLEWMDDYSGEGVRGEEADMESMA